MRSQSYICPSCRSTKTIQANPNQTTHDFLMELPLMLPCGFQGCQDTMVKQARADDPVEEKDPKVVINSLMDEPYKATIQWAAEGVKITVEADSLTLMTKGMTAEEIKAECDRRCQVIKDHFLQIIPRV